MNKKELLEGHNKEEQILISKMMDKMEEAKQKNKLTNTDFLDGYQIRICTEILNKAKFNNYIFFGGYEEAERKVAIIYPEKYDEEMLKKNYNKILKVGRTIADLDHSLQIREVHVREALLFRRMAPMAEGMGI